MSRKSKRVIVMGQQNLPDIQVKTKHLTSLTEEDENISPIEIVELTNGEVLLSGAVNGGHSPFTVSLTDVRNWLIEHKIAVV